MGTLGIWALVAMLHGVAGLCTALSLLISPKRTYYPLLRIMFAVFAGIYEMSALGTMLAADARPDPRLRYISAAVALAAFVWCVRFVRRRNRYPQFVPVDLRGVPGATDPAEVEGAVLLTLSLIRHGAAAPELVDQAREAIATYDGLTAWKRDIAAQAERRRARRGE